MKKPKLLALDLDGTLFNNDSAVSEKNRLAIADAIDSGVTVCISTGRPYIGLPLSFMEEANIRYAITTNGAAVYQVPEKRCLSSQCMSREKMNELLPILASKRMHFDVFIDGDGYSDRRMRPYIDEFDMPLPLRNYIKNSRNVVEDIASFVAEQDSPVQKITMNFPRDEIEGCRVEVNELLTKDPYFRVVCGGFHNLELTRADVSKAKALSFLCEHLGFSIADAMAIGDTENDLEMIKAAGVGVAMGNATNPVKEAADYVTLTNLEDGVAAVIREFL